jgi:hypothetical protein
MEEARQHLAGASAFLETLQRARDRLAERKRPLNPKKRADAAALAHIAIATEEIAIMEEAALKAESAILSADEIIREAARLPPPEPG